METMTNTKPIPNDRLLDARGWNCSWSILKVKSLLKEMRPGQILEVRSNDPLIMEDLPSTLALNGDQVVQVGLKPGYISLYVQKMVETEQVSTLSPRRKK